MVEIGTAVENDRRPTAPDRARVQRTIGNRNTGLLCFRRLARCLCSEILRRKARRKQQGETDQKRKLHGIRML